LIKSEQNAKFKVKILWAVVLIFSLHLTVFSTSIFAQERQFTVVIDAGHGGRDPGGVSNGYKEKDVALNVTLLLGKLLSKNNELKIAYTRTKDVFIDLWKRGKIANKAKADLFISIHCNTVDNSTAYGTETFVLGLHANKQNMEVAKKENAVILLEENYKERYKGYDPNSPESVIGLTLMQEENLDKSFEVASYVQNNFKNKLKRKDRGVKQAGFIVLNQTYMPSILIELGFLSNKTEGRYLSSKKGQQQLASQIANAITKYFDQLKLNTVATNDVVVDPTPDTDIPQVDDTVVADDVLFKIQIASSKKKIRTKSYNFKGLKNVERVKVGKYYKYYYGHSSDYQVTKKALKKAKKKGYTSAFITAFVNGEKVPLAKALK
jgi:N-acetylmuramoyl-L-alanine amidase